MAAPLVFAIPSYVPLRDDLCRLGHFEPGHVETSRFPDGERYQRIATPVAGRHFVLASTDAGRAKWVESLANDLSVEASFVFKLRLSSDRTEVTAMNAAVEGKTVLIYDDMIRTGSSLMNAAKAYRAAGATMLAALTTHGVLPADSLDRIQAAGLFTTIVSTDSHPRARRLASPFL